MDIPPRLRLSTQLLFLSLHAGISAIARLLHCLSVIIGIVLASHFEQLVFAVYLHMHVEVEQLSGPSLALE